MEIDLTGITKVYRSGARALNGIDLHIGPGTFGLLGANGAGKTTLMRIVAGIVQPTSGTVCVAGRDMATAEERTWVQRRLGYLPQELGLYPDLSAREFIDYIAILKGMVDRRARHDRVEELLNLVGLTDVASARLKTFSGGMKRRVGIAQALLNHPRLLIADEPTAGLDPEERLHFRHLLMRLETDRTVVLSTHIVEDIVQTCTNLVVLGEGRVLFQGSTAELAALAIGRAWTFTTTGSVTRTGVTVVSMLHLAEGAQYRVVADGAPTPDAVSVMPSVEDGYMVLMRRNRGTEAALEGRLSQS